MSEQASARETRLTFEGTGARQVRATALGRGTHGVPDVRRMVESQFHIAFPHRVWVAGEVGAPFDADDGLRFALHPSTGDDVFSLPCLVPSDGVAAVRDLLHRSHDADLEDVVREGRLARVGGLLRYDAARGAVGDVDDQGPAEAAPGRLSHRRRPTGRRRCRRRRAAARGRAPSGRR